jgi:hypothetical protein
MTTATANKTIFFMSHLQTTMLLAKRGVESENFSGTQLRQGPADGYPS